MSTKIVTLPIGKLVLDYTLYPRHQVDDETVRRLVVALRAGETLPPVICEADSGRVVDGFHRIAALKRHAGETAIIRVEQRVYKNEAELFGEAIRQNARHGRALSAFDLARCITRGTELGLDRATLTRCAAITDEKYDDLVKRKLALHAGERVAVKRTIAHLAGRELSADAMAANRAAGGMNQLFYVNQVLSLLRNGVIDAENDRLMEALRELAAALARFLKDNRHRRAV